MRLHAVCVTALVCASGALLGALGCGGGSKTVVVHSTVTEGSATASEPATASTSTTATAAPASTTVPVPSEPPTSFVHREAFRSPSGNIGCMIIGGGARCDIGNRSWSPPGRPSNCPPEVEFGQGLILTGSGPGRFVCAGDTSRDPRSPVLPFGTASQVGAFICVSRSSGITCTHRFNGHGFFISVESYKLF
jgi:hypothetical protein